MIGTVQHNRSGIPKEIKSAENQESLSCRVNWVDNDINLLSYVVKTKSGRKNVLLLYTTRSLMGLTKDDEKKKPSFNKFYNFTKGGTDECDQRVESYSVKPKSRKWTIVVF